MSLSGYEQGFLWYLLDEANHRCPQCSWAKINPVTGKCPLEIDHIDGDSSNNAKKSKGALSKLSFTNSYLSESKSER